MDDLIRIKCPWCSAVLTVKDFEGIETKSVTCPVCKQKSPFTKFKKVADGKIIKTICISREQKRGRLEVTLVKENVKETAFIGPEWSVPVGVRGGNPHILIKVNTYGEMSLYSSNGPGVDYYCPIYVDGKEMFGPDMEITSNSKIELGVEHYPIDLRGLMSVIKFLERQPDQGHDKYFIPTLDSINKVTDDEKEETSYLKGGYTSEQTDIDNLMIGCLKVKTTGQTFRLSPGRNVIGRKASASSANIQLDTGENHRVSREHIVIEVKKIPGKGFVHYLSLYKERVNPTFLNKVSMMFGDCMVLKNGDIISLPNFDIVFELHESEGTDF